MNELEISQLDDVVGGKMIWLEIANIVYEFIEGFRDGFSGK